MTPLRALLANLIDYAGLYPPAALALPQVLENYQRYLDGPDAWILNRLVLPAAKLNGLQLGETWRVTLLVDDAPGALPPQVEALEFPKLGTVHSIPDFQVSLTHSKGLIYSTSIKSGIECTVPNLPTYFEAPLDQIGDGFAKVRTGGLTPDAIPSSEAIADFLSQAAARRIPFKATAGLHHPLRSHQPLTYASDSPRAVMHGFINVFVAAAFAWNGVERPLLIDVLNDSRATGFEFHPDGLRWAEHRLSTAQISETRRDFAHSFGSCSFEEPVADLRKLGWLP
jgi:hypothetical protein